jgi:hypothetical protein
MLIIEGPDLVGKTTLAKAICREQSMQELGYVYQHMSRLPKGFRYPMQYEEMASRRTVRDRFHMSEVVYATVRGEVSPLNPERYRWVDGVLRALGAYTVVVLAHEDLIAQRYAARESVEMYPLAKVIESLHGFVEVTSPKSGMKPCFAGKYYRMDYDYVIFCSESQPFPTEHQVKEITLAYLARQRELDEMFDTFPA